MLSGTEVGAVAGAGAGDEAGTGIGAGSGDGVGKGEGAGAGETELGDGEPKVAWRTEARLNVGSPAGKVTT